MTTPDLIVFENDGQKITSTNYWQTEHANVGMCYLSANAGALRLLVPEAAQGMLAEMKTGHSVTIEESLHAPGQCWDIVFEDGSESPFSLAIDKKQLDRPLTPGKGVPFTIWTEGGLVQMPKLLRATIKI
jgi:hypothetical protein